MAPQPTTLFGVSPGLLHKILDVGSREAYDPQRGVKPGTLASMINRAQNPDFGPGGGWLNPGQYAVLQERGFNPNNPNIAKARAYYGTPQGQQELAAVASQLGGATDFRSTKYLHDTGNLLKYSTNLIPALIDGTRRFLTPAQLRQTKAKPDFSENTFFNESPGRRPTSKWWERLGGQQRAEVPTTGEDVLGTLTSALGFNPLEKEQDNRSATQKFLDQYKSQLMTNLLAPSFTPLQSPFGLYPTLSMGVE